MNEKIAYEWRTIHNGEGRTPNVRMNSASWFYKDSVWMVCGSGSGIGKSSEVWRFVVTEQSWERVKCSGDAPEGRDGHTGTYIGDGNFIIFGGQGFPVPNVKLGKEPESMKTKTYWKREMYNNMLQFNCDNLHWSHIHPDGLSIPMGRRGHSAIYISQKKSVTLKPDSNYHNEEVGEVQSHAPSVCSVATFSTQASHVKGSVASDKGASLVSSTSMSSSSSSEAVPANSLLVFGGCGIELSKYTQQLYSELWVFSIDNNVWSRHETRGMEPRPSYEHRVERVNDLMVVVGGITGPSKVPAGSLDLSPYSDVMLLNLLTSTWSYLKIWDIHGRPARFNFHGFAMVADKTPGQAHNLFIFGGSQVVDSKYAATSKANSISKPYPNDLTLVLDIRRAILLPITCTSSNVSGTDATAAAALLSNPNSQNATLPQLLPSLTPFSSFGTTSAAASAISSCIGPSERYGHIGISVTPPAATTAEVAATVTMSGSTQVNQTTAAASLAARKKHEKKASRYNLFDSAQETQTVEPIMYVFGGASLGGGGIGGYCDPQLYQLVRIITTSDNSLPKLSDYNNFNSAAAAAVSLNKSTNAVAAASATLQLPPSVAMNESSFGSEYSVGYKDEPSPYSPTNTASFIHRGGGGGKSPTTFQLSGSSIISSSNDIVDGNNSSNSNTAYNSIWDNMQNKPGEKREKTVKEPSNWYELKLSLTCPLSQRIFETDLINSSNSSSSGNNNNTSFGRKPHTMSTSFSSLTLTSSSNNTTILNGSSYRNNSNNNFGGNNQRNNNNGDDSSYNNNSKLVMSKHLTSSSTCNTSSLIGYNNNNNYNENIDYRPRSAPLISNGGNIATTSNSPSPFAIMTPAAVAELQQSQKRDKALRIQSLSKALRPVVKNKTKVAAKETFLKMFPHTVSLNVGSK